LRLTANSKNLYYFVVLVSDSLN